MSFKRVVVACLFLTVSLFAAPNAASALIFEPSADSPLTGPLSPGQLASGDINGDGVDDLVVASGGTDVDHPGLYVWLSDGDGSFTAVPALPLLDEASVTGLQMGQLNPDTDSDLDLIVFTDYYSDFHTLLGDGDGTFTDAGVTNIGTTPYSGGPTTKLGDLNGDGVVDLAVAGYPNKISAAINDGEGDFTVGAQQTVSGATELDSLAIGDFDGDGKNDLAMSNFGGAVIEKWAVYAMKGNGDGTFADVTGSPFQMRSGNIARSVATMDLNGDASDDLAISTQPGNDPSSNQIQTLLGSESSFFIQNPAGTVPAEDTPFNVFAGDIDGDGFADDAGAGNFGGGNVSIGLGDHAGALTAPFGSPFSLGDPPPGKRYFSQGATIADFNNDGAPDLAVGSDAGGSEVLKGIAVLMAGSDLRPTREEIQFGGWQIENEAPDEGLVVRNEGTAPGDVESATISGPDADQFDVTQPGVGCDGLTYEQECTLQVGFHPTSVGAKNATLEVTTSQSDGPIEILLSGAGVPEPVAGAEVEPTSIQFPETETGSTSAVRDVTVTSSGDLPLELAGSKLSGPDASGFTLDASACETGPVQPGSSCVVKVAFKPGSAGVKSASLDISGNVPTMSVQLSGLGFTPIPPIPDPKATLSLKAPKKIKRGKKLRVKAAVKNTGTVELTGVVLAVKVPGKLAKAPKKVTIASIPVGTTVNKTITVAVKRKAKKGKKLTVSVGVTAAGKKLASKKVVARVK